MLPKAWLSEQLTIAEAEERHMSRDIPFGYNHDKWLALIEKMQPGDELWSFNSPSEYWRSRSGRMGVAVVRSGETVACLTTMLN